jgi:2-dehydropantoate 2-reductase
MAPVLTEKNLLIVGPGALGTYFAARLGQKFRRLWMLDHRPARAAELQERGFHVTGASLFDWTPPEGHVSAQIRGGPAMDVVFFLVKAPALTAASQRAAPLVRKHTVLVFLQNGWGWEKEIKKRWPSRQIVLGLTEDFVTVEGLGRVSHGSAGLCRLDASSTMSGQVADILEHAGFSAKLEKNLEKERWNKLLADACIGLLGTLADVPNGRLLEPPLSLPLDQLVKEAVGLSLALKRSVSLNAVRQGVEDTLRRTSLHRNSLWQDVARGRPTERAFLVNPLLAGVKKGKTQAPALLFLNRLMDRVEKMSKTSDRSALSVSVA